MKKKERIDVIHVYYGTQGVAGLYIDEIYKTLDNRLINQEVFVSYYFPFNYGKKIFFKYTDLASGVKNSLLRKYIRALELILGLLYVIIYSAIKKPKIINYSLNSSLWTDIIFLKAIKFVSKANIIITCHDVIPFSKNERDKEKQIMYRKEIFDYADYLLVHNENSIKDLKKVYNVKDDKIRLHPFPLMDLGKLNFGSNFVDKEYDFAFIGHLRREKGIEVLVESWKKISKIYPNAKLLIAGNTPSKIDSFKEIENTNVDFKLKFLTDKEYIDYINKSSTIILPYEEGTNSGVVYNLISLDVNIIYSNLGMFTSNSLLDENGVFERGNVEDLVKRMEFYYKKNKISNRKLDDYKKSFDLHTYNLYKKILQKEDN